MTRDWLIVGCGFTGATAARLLAERGERVLVIDKRPHIAGNAFDALNEDGVLVHRYGPHIFHTNSSRVFAFLSRFTEWSVYFHHVKAMVGGRYVPVPFNFNSIEQTFPARKAQTLIENLIDEHGFDARVPILKLRDSKSSGVRELADYVYENVFLNYTLKQWALRPEELDPAVTSRVPILLSRDDRYFQDRYQAMPRNGYTSLFTRMLDHENIAVETAVDWRDVKTRPGIGRTIFTGPVDEFFDWEHGVLPYRSIEFVFDRAPFAGIPDGATTINFPGNFDFTRITQQNRLTMSEHLPPLNIYEYPQAYELGVNDPYYPIPAPHAKAQLALYDALKAKLRGQVFFAGRLGDYLYYNMDQACARAMALVEKEIPAAG